MLRLSVDEMGLISLPWGLSSQEMYQKSSF